MNTIDLKEDVIEAAEEVTRIPYGEVNYDAVYKLKKAVEALNEPVEKRLIRAAITYCDRYGSRSCYDDLYQAAQQYKAESK